MHLNFRQGLISFQQSGPQALFLVPSTKAGCVDISVTPTPLIGTIAHGSSDYLLQFDATIPAAFGPLIADSDNYLYIELNVITGLTTYGISLLEPKTSSVEPADAAPGQMWFDLTTTVMKVRSNDGLKWLVSPRLVIGKVRNGNVNQIIPALVGTSVSLNVPGHPGFLMLDSLLRPLRTSTGELLTSDSAVRIKTTVGTAGVLALPTNGFVSVRANEAIPAMSLVYFSGPDSVSLASSNPALTVPKAPLGVCQQDLAQNEVGTITQAGEITSDQFNWADAECGLPLYCGWNGEITSTRPQGLQAYRVGYIKNSKTILFYVDSETQVQVLATAGSIISGAPPITANTVVNRNNEIVTTVSMSEASAVSDGYMTSSQAQLISTFDGRTSQNEAAIISLQASKATIIHSHIVPDVSGLQAIIDGKSDIGHLHPEYALVLHSHPEYALLQHVHFVSEVTGLQAVLNNKSDIAHTHLIADTDGLQIALDSKAFANHTHTIGNVSGLQANLDSKAALIHIHGIADVTGLQATLNTINLAISAPHTLAQSLADVVLTAPVVNDVLTFDGTQWTNQPTVMPPVPFQQASQVFVLSGTQAFGSELTVWPNVNELYPAPMPFASYASGAFTLAAQGIFRIKVSVQAGIGNQNPGLPWPNNLSMFGTTLINSRSSTQGPDRSNHSRFSDQSAPEKRNDSLGTLFQPSTWYDEYMVMGYLGDTLSVTAFTSALNSPVMDLDYQMVLTIEYLSTFVLV